MQWGVIVLIFLFFLRVIRAVWVEMSPALCASPVRIGAERGRSGRRPARPTRPKQSQRRQLFLKVVSRRITRAAPTTSMTSSPSGAPRAVVCPCPRTSTPRRCTPACSVATTSSGSRTSVRPTAPTSTPSESPRPAAGQGRPVAGRLHRVRGHPLTVLRSGSATHVGRVRQINQDLPLERPNLYAVADGMGGHVGGEVAARVAVETLERSFGHAADGGRPRPGLRRGQPRRLAGEPGQHRAAWHGHHVDRRGSRGRRRRARRPGAGQRGRLTGLRVLGRTDLPGHGRPQPGRGAGAPRGDHGARGRGAPATPHPHPRSRGVAPRSRPTCGSSSCARATVSSCAATASRTRSTCEDMAAVLADEPDPGEAARRLVDAANRHGGADNITVVVVDVLGGRGRHRFDVGREAAPVPAAVVATPVGGRGRRSGGGREDDTAGAPNRDRAEQQAPEGDGATGTPKARLPADSTSGGTASAPSPRHDGIVPAVDDTLAPGSRLGFDADSFVGGLGPHSDQFFLGSVDSAPLARARLAFLSHPSEPVEKPKVKESRRARRRRLGIPRRVTFRVFLFVLLWRPSRWRPTSFCGGTPTTTGRSRCGATRWWWCRASRAACCGSNPRSWTTPASPPRRSFPPPLAAAMRAAACQEPSLAEARGTTCTNLVSQYDQQHAPPPTTTTSTIHHDDARSARPRRRRRQGLPRREPTARPCPKTPLAPPRGAGTPSVGSGRHAAGRHPADLLGPI